MYAKVEKHAFSVTPAKYISKIDKYPFELMGNRATGVIYLNPITHEEIKQILFFLNSTTGWGDIAFSLIKLSSEFIVQPLPIICNQPLSEGILTHQFGPFY